MLAGYWQRGISFLLSVLALGALTTWTISQAARFPDFGLSLRLFLPLLLQALALILFLLAVQRLLFRYVIQDNVTKAFSNYVLWLAFTILIVALARPFLALAGVGNYPREIHELTAVMSAGALAALWIWIAADAGHLGAKEETVEVRSIVNAILIACVLIFFLGYAITGIDLPKAVTEYQDTDVLLSRVFWPWRDAFEFHVDTVEVTQRVQGPCPEGTTGPEPNPAHPTEAWVSVTPTCGDLTVRDIQGNVTLGTELTITGGNFTPGDEIRILWKNPIGNAFEPRGVGETRLTVAPDGSVQSTMYFPEVVIASTSAGDQIHTLVLRESSEEVFTGRLSAEMELALVGILESIMIGLMATFFGIILAFPVSFLAARNLMAPIISPLSEVVGSLLGIVAGLYAALFITGQVMNLFGGLDRAPLIIFAVFLISMIGLAIVGFRLGNALVKWVENTMGATVITVVTVVGLSLATAAIGYLLGIGFSRGIVAIPLTAEGAAEMEGMFAFAGALLGALAGVWIGWQRRATGDVRIGLLIYGAVRTVLNIVRSIEPIIWGIVAIIWIGPGPFAGTIALTLHTIAALGKLYSESIESIDAGPIEALQATGANRLQTIIYAVIPQILPPFISFTIYRWDINVRMSTVIGLVGGGGIGFILIQWIRLFQYEAAGIAVWLITITVATMDYISSNIRERYI
jgi:phosphonate ABC transporter permease subunit PhnE